MTGIFVKLLPGFSPWFIVAGRSLVSLLVVIPFFIGDSGTFRSGIKNGENWILGCLMMLYYITAVSAYQLTSVAEVALLLNTSPLFALLIKTRRKMPVSKKEWIGTLLAFLGVMVMIVPELALNQNILNSRLWGALLALSSSYVITVYAIRIEEDRNHGKEVDIRMVTLLTYVLGFLLLGTISFILKPESIHGIAKSPMNLGLLVGLGVFSTVIPSVAYGVSAKLIDSVKLTTTRLLIPVAASLFAFAFLNEIPNVWVLPGGVLIILGISLTLNHNESNDQKYQ